MVLRRRAFLRIAAAVLAPRPAAAQTARAVPHIGWISTDREPDPFLDGFREGLRQYGYQEGKNAVLSNVDHPGEPSERRATEAAAHRLGLGLTYVAFNTAAEFEQGLRGVRDARPDAMVVFPEGATVANRIKVAQFALAQRLPSMFGWSEYVDAGGLMSYGANVRDAYVQLAAYADRVLRGARPGDLPIVQPTRFELVVNANTAKLLDLAIPPTIVVRAARLIE